jgi:hypothetical protein
MVATETDFESHLAELLTPEAGDSSDTAYQQLVSSIVGGARPSPAEVRAALDQAGRTPRELATHCRTVRQRREATEALSKPTGEPESARPIRQTIAALDEAAAKLEAEHKQRLQKLAQQRAQALDQIAAAEKAGRRSLADAKRLLIESAPAALLNAMHAQRNRIASLAARRLRQEAEVWELDVDGAAKAAAAAEKKIAELKGKGLDDSAVVTRLEYRDLGEARERIAKAGRIREDAAAALEQEAAAAREHNATVRRIYDWRSFDAARDYE